MEEERLLPHTWRGSFRRCPSVRIQQHHRHAPGRSARGHLCPSSRGARVSSGPRTQKSQEDGLFAQPDLAQTHGPSGDHVIGNRNHALGAKWQRRFVRSYRRWGNYSVWSWHARSRMKVIRNKPRSTYIYCSAKRCYRCYCCRFCHTVSLSLLYSFQFVAAPRKSSSSISRGQRHLLSLKMYLVHFLRVCLIKATVKNLRDHPMGPSKTCPFLLFNECMHQKFPLKKGEHCYF